MDPRPASETDPVRRARCRNCTSFDPLRHADGAYLTADSSGVRIGYCRVVPPFEQVLATEWCRQWEPNPACLTEDQRARAAGRAADGHDDHQIGHAIGEPPELVAAWRVVKG